MMMRVIAMTGAVWAAAASAPAMAQDEETPPKWEVRCEPLAEGEPETCSIFQELVQADTGQRMMSVTVFYTGEPAQPGIVFALPLGVFLPPGAAYTVDEGEQHRFDFQACDSSGCMATVPLSEEELAELSGGGEISVLFKTIEDRTYGLTFELEGFADALAEITPS